VRQSEDRKFIPDGANRAVTFNVHVISATSNALRREVGEGRFRDDLSYRLRVVPLLLPPLRRRDGDVEALFWHFVNEMNQQGMRRIEGVTRTAMDAILAYPWPGNVRELRSAVEYAFVVGEGPLLDVADLTPELRGEPPPGMPVGSLADIERGRILAALARHHGRKAAAAAERGMSRTTLWRQRSAPRLRGCLRE